MARLQSSVTGSGGRLAYHSSVLTPDPPWLIGALAGTLTTLSFIPQVLRSWRRRSVDDLSTPMLVAFSIGVSLWVVYGVLANAGPIIAANVVTLALAGALLVMKWRFR